MSILFINIVKLKQKVFLKMLRTDAQDQTEHNVLGPISSITIDVMLEIQKELEPYDIVSMVFLLYDVPDTALQRLITYQRVFKDFKSNNLNLLYEWALYAQSKPTWRYEFLEALTTCRLFSVIRKLGFNVTSVKQHYDPNNINVSIYIPSVKKVLYKLCENITSTTCLKLKDTLISYDIDVTEHEYCEMIILDLICQKFIVYDNLNNKDKSPKRTQLEKLARIIENYEGLQYYANQLREIEIKLNNEHIELQPGTSTQKLSKTKVDDIKPENKTVESNEIHPEDFSEEFELLCQLNSCSLSLENLKSDKSNLNENVYPIKNPKRVGLCCIINQEKFHPTKSTIENGNNINILSDRLGSRRDQIILEKTMRDINFYVKTGCNLKYNEIFEFILKCIKSSIPEDSMFVLCILSHGVRGHIFSSDSLKVKVEDIQNILDSDDALHLRGKPKVLILQACQVDESPKVPLPRLVADSATTTYYLRKSHFLIYWATAPEYEAFRDEERGSIFIQALCYFIKKKAHQEQMCNICTMVTDSVTNFCTQKKCVQVPLFESTLRKKLYLCLPDVHNVSKGS